MRKDVESDLQVADMAGMRNTLHRKFIQGTGGEMGGAGWEFNAPCYCFVHGLVV